MPTWTFIKRGGAPAGPIKIEVSDGEFTIDDSGNPSIVTSSPTVAAELIGVPYLQLQGGAPTPAPVLHSVDTVFLDNGVLSKAGPNRTTVPLDVTNLPDFVARNALVRAPFLDAHGHSYVAGVGASVQGKSFTHLLADTYGLPLRDESISGEQLVSAGDGVNPGYWASVLQRYSPSRGFVARQGLSLVMWGINDLNSQGNTTAQLAAFKHCLRTVISRLRAGALFEETDASFAFQGGLNFGAHTSSNSGLGTAVVTTNGNTYTITTPADFPGGTVAIGITSRNDHANTGAIHTATLNGVAQPAFDTRNTTNLGTSSPIGCVYRIPNVPAGSNTIIVTVSSVTDLTQPDYWQWEPPTANAPVVVLPLQPLLVDYSAYGAGGTNGPPTDVGVANINQIVNDLAAEFDSRVIPVDLSAMNRISAQFATDKLHPSDLGHLTVYSTVRAALDGAKLAPVFSRGFNSGIAAGYDTISGTAAPQRVAYEEWQTTPPSSYVPLSAQRNYLVGDVVWNSSPSVGQPVGWVCVTQGAPGTWKPFGTVGPPVPVTVSSFGAAGWGNAPGVCPVHYFLDNSGLLHVGGMAKTTNGTATDGVTIFTLPAGFRPPTVHSIAAWRSDLFSPCQVVVNPDGTVQYVGNGALPAATVLRIDDGVIALTI